MSTSIWNQIKEKAPLAGTDAGRAIEEGAIKWLFDNREEFKKPAPINYIQPSAAIDAPTAVAINDALSFFTVAQRRYAELKKKRSEVRHEDERTGLYNREANLAKDMKDELEDTSNLADKTRHPELQKMVCWMVETLNEIRVRMLERDAEVRKKQEEWEDRRRESHFG